MELAIFIALTVDVCLVLILMRLLRYGMGLKNIPGQVMMVIIGIVLVCVVMIPNLLAFRKKPIKLSKTQE